MKNKGKVIILTEEGYGIGTGHFVRMSGLMSRLLDDSYPVEMYVQRDCGFRTRGAEKELVWINDFDVLTALVGKDDVVVIDCYNTELSFLKKVTGICRKLIVIDDYLRLDYEGMVVINPNYYGSFMNYPKDKGNVYYLGKDYTLLRPQFFCAHTRSIEKKVNRVLVTLGGTDVSNLTHKIIEYCHKLESNTILDVVVTNQFHNIDDIKKVSSSNDNIHFNIGAHEMNRLMNEVDFAVASAGGTSNELIKTQCPSILIKVADNQSLNISYLEPLHYFMTFDENHLENIKEMYDQNVREKICNVLAGLETDLSAKDAVEFVYDNY